jgi:hypothetical protein
MFKWEETPKTFIFFRGGGAYLGYKYSQGYRHETDDKFDLSGLSITLNLLNYKV